MADTTTQAPTTTAATPEELARTARLRITKELCGFLGFEAEEIIAAAIRQHSEAQRAEIERLTAEVDDLKDKLDHIDWVRSERRDPPTPEIEEGIKRAADVLFFTAVNRDNPAAAEDIWCLAMDVLRLAPTHDARWKELEAEMERTAAAKAALAASQESERKLTEALEKCAAAFEQPLTGIEEAALNAARAALQPQETADGKVGEL